MAENDHLKKSRWSTDTEAPQQRTDDPSMFGGSDIGRRTRRDGLVTPNVPVRESALIQRHRARKAAAEQRAAEDVQHTTPDAGIGEADPTDDAASSPVEAAGLDARAVSPLDRAYSNTLHTGTGNRAQAATRKPGPPPETLSDADQVVHANIVAAQNELEEVLNLASGAKVDVKQLDAKIAQASLFLGEAVSTMPQSNANSGKIDAALTSLYGYQTRVDNLVHIRALNGDKDSAAYEAIRQGSLAQFLRAEGVLMRRFGIPAKPTFDATLGKGKDADAPEIDAIKASLQLADVQTKQGFDQLSSHAGDATGRDAIVRAVAGQIYGHISHASLMSGTLDLNQKAAIKPNIEAVSANVLLIKRWMDGRQGNKAMIDAFSNVLLALNSARANVGLNAVDLAEAKGFPEREVAEEVVEKGKMDAAVGKFAEAWQSLESAMEEGVEQWFELAKKSENNKPSFAENLLSALITSAVGNLGGAVMKAMFQVAKDDAVMVALQDIAKGVTTDAGKTIFGPAIKEAISNSGEGVPLRSLLFVRSGLKQICRSMKSAHVTELHDKVARGELSIAQVQGLEVAARGAEAQAQEKLKFQSATEWVRYVAQAGMRGQSQAHENGYNEGKTADGATDLGGFFGTAHEGGRSYPAGRTGDHENEEMAGVLRIEVRAYEQGITGRTSGVLDITKLDVTGLNKEMAVLILSDPSIKTLDDVKVPKMVVVEFAVPLRRASVAHPKLMFVVDERGRIRDSKTVRDERHKDVDAPENSSIWQDIRTLPVSGSASGIIS